MRTHVTLPRPKCSRILESLLLNDMKHTSYRLLSADDAFNLPANRYVGHVPMDGERSDRSARYREHSR